MPEGLTGAGGGGCPGTRSHRRGPSVWPPGYFPAQAAQILALPGMPLCPGAVAGGPGPYQHKQERCGSPGVRVLCLGEGLGQKTASATEVGRGLGLPPDPVSWGIGGPGPRGTAFGCLPTSCNALPAPNILFSAYRNELVFQGQAQGYLLWDALWAEWQPPGLQMPILDAAGLAGSSAWLSGPGRLHIDFPTQLGVGLCWRRCDPRPSLCQQSPPCVLTVAPAMWGWLPNPQMEPKAWRGRAMWETELGFELWPLVPSQGPHDVRSPR